MKTIGLVALLTALVATYGMAEDQTRTEEKKSTLKAVSKLAGLGTARVRLEKHSSPQPAGQEEKDEVEFVPARPLAVRQFVPFGAPGGFGFPQPVFGASPFFGTPIGFAQPFSPFGFPVSNTRIFNTNNINSFNTFDGIGVFGSPFGFQPPIFIEPNPPRTIIRSRVPNPFSIHSLPAVVSEGVQTHVDTNIRAVQQSARRPQGLPRVPGLGPRQ